MKQGELIAIDATLTRIRYSKQRWKILICRSKSGNVTITGEFSDLTEGSLYTFTGYFDKHPKYGEQFVSKYYKEILPRERNQIARFLEARINGLGIQKSLSIATSFGESTFDVIKESPSRLVEVDGINSKLAELIHSQFMEIHKESGVKTTLTGFGLTKYQVDIIHKKFGEEAIEIFEKNPYRLIEELDGFAFKRVDSMALSSGFTKFDSKFRIVAGIKYVINNMVPNFGHTYMPRDKFVKATSKELDVDKKMVEDQLEYAEELDFLIIENDNICNAKLYTYENTIAATLTEIIKKYKAWDVSDISEEILSPCRGQQVSAVKNSFHTAISVITGPPGTGKTWTLKQILKYFKSKHMKVALAAPTGKAAKRMQESIEDNSYKCSTIHVLLRYHPMEGFRINRYAPLEVDVVVIDEFSMCDTELAFHLFEACINVKQILIIGDIDQLPSVGPGKVMSAIIGCSDVNTTRLIDIQRQSKESSIIANAVNVNNGIEIDYNTEHGSDFFFIERNEKESIAKTIPQIIKTAKDKYGFNPNEDIQILCPQKKGDIGVHELNKIMRAILNPEAKGDDFCVNDKVVQTKNNYEIKIFNGECGIVKEVNEKGKYYLIDFGYDSLTKYPFNKNKHLNLSYALTIHRSQGSEFPLVIIPIHTTNYIMLQRNLLYTAITRGKKKVIIVGSRKAVLIAVKNCKPIERYNRLEGLLNGL